MKRFRRLLPWIGLAYVLAGGAALIYGYAFASMVDPEMTAQARRLAILSRMFALPEGIYTILACGMVLAGISLIAVGSSKTKQS